MNRRYLFGPIAADYAATHLGEPRRRGECLAFDLAGGADLTLAATDSWQTLLQRLPADWKPEFLVLWLPYALIPGCLWTAPLPIIGLAADWQILWHGYRRQLRLVDLVLTDALGVETLAREGIAHAQVAQLYGCAPAFCEGPWPDEPRDIDVLFVGNFHPAIQRERLAWLGRLARLAQRRRVELHTGVFGEDYRRLLGRARIVFNRSIRGECNQRVAEVLSAGALLFQEADNLEVPKLLQEGKEYIAYTPDNLEERLEYYLEREDERRAVSGAGRRRAAQLTFPALWEQALACLESDWTSLVARSQARQALTQAEQLTARSWEAWSGPGTDPSLASDLASQLVSQPHAAELHNALGLTLAHAACRGGPLSPPAVRQAVSYFDRAFRTDPWHVMARLNLVECLASLDQKDQAIEQARALLTILDRPDAADAAWLDAGHFPPGFDLFRVAWEKAAWANAGNRLAELRDKRTLVRCRTHSLLATLTQDLAHYHEAALARPDLPPTRAALGCALGRQGRISEAICHLRQAATDNPFDLEAARALFQALGDSGDAEGQRAWAFERSLMARAAPQLVPREPWFREATATRTELASLIILCCNERAYTELCLESVLLHTRAPYELILVDNGSTDGTDAYLEALRAKSGPVRVEVIHNPQNLGFPKGCNQGLQKAKGRFLVLLNNDTIVTQGWLEGLIAWAVHDDMRVGLVGATSNYCPPPQQVAFDYADRPGLEAFAARRRHEYAGKAVEVERLTGFCLLVRRDLLEEVGGFDERFGAGFFDDDDLCVRARRAGFHLLVAQGVYIHHFGSRTFAGQGIDCQEQLRSNFERFVAKWGPEQGAGYRLPDPAAALAPPAAVWPPLEAFRLPAAGSDGAASDATAVAPTAIVGPSTNGRRLRRSLCMIVKNEAENLPRSLGSAVDLFDDVVVVDTGSTDGTKEVAAQLGARVFDFPWCDSFSAARNAALEHARGDWIFWLDGDDHLDADNHEQLHAMLDGLTDENVAYSMKCLCLPDARTGASTQVDHIRLFRNHPQIRWQYRVHEQILPAIRACGGEVRFADVVIRHSGYCDTALRQKKLERDLRLLRLEEAEQPHDPFTLFNLGAITQELGRHAEAIPLLRQSLERSQPSDSIVRKLYALMASCHRALGQRPEALQACAQGRQHYPDDIELLFQEGILRREEGDLEGAARSLEQLLYVQQPPHFASIDAGLQGYKGRHNLGLVYQQQGRLLEAEAQWQAALAERPGFLPSLLGLAELYLGLSRWTEFEGKLGQLAADPEAALETAVLRARAYLARKEFSAARSILTETIAQNPRVPWPHVILSHVLLQEGRDLVGAEEALRDVLALDPSHAEAKHNLSVLLQRQNRACDAYVAQGLTLADLYQQACTVPSDIRGYLPVLFELASRCRHVTVLGARHGSAATALLFAQPDALVCYDLRQEVPFERLKVLAGRSKVHFRRVDVVQVEIEPTELLLCDTRHTYEQLHEELRRHAAKAKKYIVIPATAKYGTRGEGGEPRGLWPAVEEFLALGTFRLEQRYDQDDGLTVLAAATQPAPEGPSLASIPTSDTASS
jgi:GT2 family glycosyltransferase/tetratricopeptide (TPR) repeat protein